MNRLLVRLCAILMVVFILTASIPVLTKAAANISSSHTSLEISLAPGQNLERIVTIGSNSGTELVLEVNGLTQTLLGVTDVLPLTEDTSTFSARPFINLDTTTINLAANDSQDIKVFVNIPAGTAPGEKYALIYIHTQPGDGMVITGMLIPVIVNVTGYSPSRSGTITDLNVSNNYTGKAIDFNTTFANSGNCRISGAKNLVVVKDGSGVEKWRQEASISAPSMLPGIPRQITARYNVGLPAGNYSIKSDITLEAGVLLATQTINFTVTDPPPVPAAPGLSSPGSSTAPGPVIDTLAPTFQWNSLAYADYYTLIITRYPYGAEDRVYDSDQLIGTSYSLPSGYLFGGQKYAWVLKATNNISGSGEVSQQFYFQSPGSSTPPAVTTGAATNITDSGVTLNGNLTALGTATTVPVYFEIGSSANYGTVIEVPAMTAPGTFSANINNLLANTTYYYRAKASGSTAVYGSNMTFTTTGSSAISSIAASNITSSGASLNGNLTALGGANSVSVNFEYGVSTSYGNSTPAQTKTGTGEYSASITGLTPNTIYHFRAKALSGSTTVFGADMTFNTLAASPSPATSTPATTTPTPAGPPASTVPGSTANYMLEGMDPTSLVVFAFTKEATFASAYQEAGLEVLLTGIERNGVIALAKYLKETILNPAFSDPISKGGTGKPAIKFVNVFVEGARKGKAEVTVYYSQAEIQEFNPDSLFLAYYYNGKWHKCSNIKASQNDLAVTGDIPINRLTGTVVGLGGSLKNEIPAVFPPINTSQPAPDKGIPWSLAGIMIGTAIIIGVVILIVDRKRRKSPTNN